MSGHGCPQNKWDKCPAAPRTMRNLMARITCSHCKGMLNATWTCEGCGRKANNPVTFVSPSSIGLGMLRASPSLRMPVNIPGINMQDMDDGLVGERIRSVDGSVMSDQPPIQKRKPKGEGLRSGTEQIVWKDVTLMDGTKKKVPRINGSKPMKERTNGPSQKQRDLIMNQHFQTYERAEDKNSIEAMSALFSALLIKRGDHIGGINRQTGSCKNDGNVRKYVVYMKEFVKAEVVSKLDDFCHSNRRAAMAFSMRRAIKLAPTQRVRRKTWDELSARQRETLVNRLCGIQMHGFDDFVRCLEAEKKQATRPSVVTKKRKRKVTTKPPSTPSASYAPARSTSPSVTFSFSD